MESSEQVLAIIPARSGSKGIPRKNIALVGGQPLIAWSIQAARAATQVSRAIVSTDGAEIAEVARTYGAEIPFMRPVELAQDHVGGMAPILHALRWTIEHSGRVDWVLCLQPTSPLRTAEDIDAAIMLGRQKNAAAVVSVCPVSQHPYWTKYLDPAGRIRSFIPDEAIPARRQDLPSLYALNGAIYLARSALLLERETWYTDDTYAYVMPPERSLDVDTPWDLRLADLILQERAPHGHD